MEKCIVIESQGFQRERRRYKYGMMSRKSLWGWTWIVATGMNSWLLKYVHLWPCAHMCVCTFVCLCMYMCTYLHIFPSCVCWEGQEIKRLQYQWLHLVPGSCSSVLTPTGTRTPQRNDWFQAWGGVAIRYTWNTFVPGSKEVLKNVGSMSQHHRARLKGFSFGQMWNDLSAKICKYSNEF